jgi:hypothetical protein
MRIRLEDYAIHNAMEDMADQAIEQVLSEDRTACDCPDCRDDVKSQILNKVPPFYHPLISGEPRRQSIMLEDLATDLFNKIMVECYKALIRVKENPRHSDDRSELHNTTERILRLAVGEVLSNQKVHLDRDDLSRLMSGALNGLKPAYTTTHKGDAFTRASEIDTAYLAQVYSEIFKALDGLKGNDAQTS